jgi:transposase
VREWSRLTSLTERRLRGGLRPLFPNIRTVIADAGHQSRKLAHHLLRQDGWKLQIVKRRQRAFKMTGLTWIVERSFAWLGRNRRLSKDYEYSVQSSDRNAPYAQPPRSGMRILNTLLVSENEADASKIPWVAPLIERSNGGDPLISAHDMTAEIDLPDVS